MITGSLAPVGAHEKPRKAGVDGNESGAYFLGSTFAPSSAGPPHLDDDDRLLALRFLSIVNDAG